MECLTGLRGYGIFAPGLFFILVAVDPSDLHTSFYRYKELCEKGGEEALIEISLKEADFADLRCRSY